MAFIEPVHDDEHIASCCFIHLHSCILDDILWQRYYSIIMELCINLQFSTWVSVCLIGCLTKSWWRHQMETFSTLLAICAGNSPVPGEFPTQRPVTWSFDVYFDLRPNKRLSKQSPGWWFETLSCPLWRHRNVVGQWVPHCLTHSLKWYLSQSDDQSIMHSV